MIISTIKKLILNCIFILFILLSISCQNNKTDLPLTANEIESDSNKFLPPLVTNIELSNLPKITPGKYSVPLPYFIKLDKPDIQPIKNLPIIPGKSFLPQTKEQITTGLKPKLSKIPKVVKLNTEKLQICTPGKHGFALPKIYKIEKQYSQNLNNNWYTVQQSDTIYPSVFKSYPHPKSNPALMPKYKDNATQNIRFLSSEEGLSNVIWGTSEDNFGNIWFSTFFGGFRFDGSSFKNYTTKEGLGHNWVSSVFTDKNGNIWFMHAMSHAGVSCYNGKGFSHFTTKQGLCDNTVNSMLEDKKGNLWFATAGGVSCYDGKSFTNYTIKQGLCYNDTYDIIEDKKGNLWIATRGGISCFTGKSFVNFTVNNGFFKATSVLEDKTGKFWFAGGYGAALISFDGELFTYYTEDQGLISNNILKNNNLIEDDEGNIWVGTDKGISCFNGESFINITSEHGLSNDIVTSIFKDKTGKLWIGTRGEGVNILSPNSFKHFTENQGLPETAVRAAYEDSKGNLWFGTWSGGLSCFNGQSFVNYDLTKNLKGPGHNDIQSIVEDKNGNLWIGTLDGLNCFDGENMLHYNTEHGLSDHGIVHLYKDSHDLIWIGTQTGGLCCWDGNSFIDFSSIKQIGIDRLRPMTEDKAGNLWIASCDKGVSFFDGNSFTTYTKEQGLSNNNVYSIITDKTGGIVIGTEGSGLNFLIDQEFIHFGTNEGLSNDFITSLATDKQNNIWVGSMKGLTLLASDFFAGISSDKLIKNSKSKIITPVTFGVSEGLKGSSIYQNSLFVDSKNRLWIGTNKALSVLDMNKFKVPNSIPKIQLNRIDILDTFIDFRKGKEAKLNDRLNDIYLKQLDFDSVPDFYNFPLNLKLPNKLNHLTLYFSAIDWAAPYKIMYQYKLEGLEDHWSQTSSKNFADYRNIPYGDYIFKVRAVGASGKFSDTYEYSFTVLPPWWHTLWARTIYIILILGLIYLSFKWRTAYLTKRKKQLEEEVQIATKEIESQRDEIQSIVDNLLEANEEIINQKEEIQEINLHLSDSIKYAKRIQMALLTPEEYVNQLYFESFIIYLPKDVVSGDFYWIRQIHEYVIVVAADCTGHGVPGAFMSMLGIAFLNEIVQKQEVTQANYILNEMRKLVKKSLRQTGKFEEAKDGMDMAVCVINKKTNNMQYSGAYNPICIIRNKELRIIKADRMPVGIHINEKASFTNHELQLEKDDLIYMFSDGFQDQMGGKKSKKYMRKNFMDMLLSNTEYSMYSQKERILKIFKEWKGKHDQTDDVVIIGIKI